MDRKIRNEALKLLSIDYDISDDDLTNLIYDTASDYKEIESQKLFDIRNLYLSVVTKEQFLKNEDYKFYMRAVTNGFIPACKFIKGAIKREQDKFDDPDCPYTFDPEDGWRFFNFCRYFTILEGPKGGKKTILSDWQIWVFSMLLGWKRTTGQKAGFRLYNTAYLECPRGSGKSTMMGLFGLFMLTLDGEWSPQVYVAATKRDQANLLFKPVIKQVEASSNKKLMAHLKVKRSREDIVCTADKGGYFKSLSKDGKSFDGMNPHCSLVDECHAHPDREIWDVLNSGSAKRNQSIMIGITTAGHNFSGFGCKMSTYVKKLVTDQFEEKDDSFFGCVWTIDEKDDLYDPDVWIKANPSWWSSAINHEKFTSDVLRTKNEPTSKTEVFTKLLNVWWQSNDKWLAPEAITERNAPIPDEKEMSNVPCIIGIDLANSDDMQAYVNVYEKWHDQDQKYHYYVYPKYFTPAVTIKSGRRPRYSGWVHDDLLTPLGEQVMDQDAFQAMLEQEWHQRYVMEYAFDRYNASQMAGSLQNKFGEGSVYMVNQSMSGSNEASKFFKRLLLEGRIHFHNEIFVWNCLNAVVRVNNTGLVLVEKDESAPLDKIDGLKACINALDRFLARMNYIEPSIEIIN